MSFQSITAELAVSVQFDMQDLFWPTHIRRLSEPDRRFRSHQETRSPSKACHKRFRTFRPLVL